MKIILNTYEEFEVVDTVNDGKEAVEYCKKNDVDIALLDVRMPNMNGVEATAFQLVKCYATGLGFYLRPILKPRPGLRIGVDGVEMLNGWRVDFTTGIVTFDAAPASGAALTAGFFYDVPVRFDTESLGVQATGAGALGAPQIDLIEDPRFRSSADEESLLFLDLTNPLAAFVNEDYPGAFTAADPGDPPAAPSNLSATATWTASASFAGTAPGNVADGDDATVWGNNNAVPVMLQAEFGSAATIYVYRLGRVTVTGWTPDTYSPVDWTFEGSDDGTAWTVLDTQTGQALTTDLPPTSYAVESPQAFRFYRLNIGSGGINNWVSLSLVDLIGRV